MHGEGVRTSDTSSSDAAGDGRLNAPGSQRGSEPSLKAMSLLGNVRPTHRTSTSHLILFWRLSRNLSSSSLSSEMDEPRRFPLRR